MTGGVVSMVKEAAAEAVLPAASLPETDRVCVPSAVTLAPAVKGWRSSVALEDPGCASATLKDGRTAALPNWPSVKPEMAIEGGLVSMAKPAELVAMLPAASWAVT